MNPPVLYLMESASRRTGSSYTPCSQWSSPEDVRTGKARILTLHWKQGGQSTLVYGMEPE